MPYIAAIRKKLEVLGVTSGRNDSRGGPDVIVLGQNGVPIAALDQDGRDYFDFHHTPDDTFDKIIPSEFRQNVAAYAAFAYIASETGWDFRKAAEPDPESEE